MRSIIASFLQAGPPEIRWGGAGIAIIAASVYEALGGILVGIMLVLFGVDVVLGLCKAVHRGGLGAFSWDRFARAGIKLIAAMCGIVLGVTVDLWLQHMGFTSTAAPVTTGVLGYLCCGFGAGAGQNLGYFFPGVETVVHAAMRKVLAPGEPPQRRASDREDAGS